MNSKLATRVYIRLIFLRIGEINTLNEKYQAQLIIESRWSVEIDEITPELSFDDQKRLIEGKSVSLLNYAESHWHPQLYIENALGDLKEKIRHTAKRSRENHRIYICEHRDVKGVFWEKLELQHFPSDVQDFSISIASMFDDDKVVLLKDPHHLSGVIREDFSSQQEWSLYQRVDIDQRSVREFLVHGLSNFDTDDDEVKDERLGYRRRSILTVTCHAARQSNYFFWNGYCLIFLITAVSFCIFGIPGHLAGNRIQISCTLLLTSITFRWTVNRSLPTISYLTSMDIYGIICIFILIFQCFWHGILGVLIFLKTNDFRLTPDMQLVHIDQYVFWTALSVFIVIHFLFLLWLFAVPLKHRRHMAAADMRYRLSLSSRSKRNVNQRSKNKTKNLSAFARIPIGK